MAYHLTLFPAESPLDTVVMGILGQLPKRNKGYLFTPLMVNRFTKITNIVPLQRIRVNEIASPCNEHWVFSYAPETLLP